MVDWQNKLENSIKSLENQSQLLSSAVELYDNINKLQNDLTDSYLGFEEVKSDFDKISNNLNTDLLKIQKEIENIRLMHANKMDVFFDENNKHINQIEIKIVNLKKDLADEINNLITEFKLITHEHNELLNAKIDSLNDFVINKFNELFADNKAFQKEIDSNLISRLEKHKSDIQVEIRNEGTQIQRAFENTLTSNFNNMESKLQEHFKTQTKQMNLLKVLLFVSIGIGITIAIGLFMKI